MTNKIICDRCKQEIPPDVVEDNQIIFDNLVDKYPGKFICLECDRILSWASALQTEDLINGDKPGTALKKMCKMYGVETAGE